MVEIEMILAGLIVWNLVLTYLIWRTISYFRRLTKGVKQGNLEEVLQVVMKSHQLAEKEVSKLKKQLTKLENENKFCFQKASLVKFNPFSDLGGDQSFSLALLDKEDRGIVITSLHGRQATRVYTKLVGEEQKLSNEEKKAIKQATRAKKNE